MAETRWVRRVMRLVDRIEAAGRRCTFAYVYRTDPGAARDELRAARRRLRALLREKEER